MDTIKQEIKKEEIKAKEIKNEILRFPLRKTQTIILQSVVQEKTKLQELLRIIEKKEQDLIDFTLGFYNIEKKDIQSLSLTEDQESLEIVLKKEELKK